MGAESLYHNGTGIHVYSGGRQQSDQVCDWVCAGEKGCLAAESGGGVQIEWKNRMFCI